MTFKSALITLLASVLLSTWGLPAQAQQLPTGPKPVMENVFFNVVWGSAAGALLGAAMAVTGSKDKSQPTGVREGGFQGATGGGVIGLGLGIWLVFTGITFDPNQSTLVQTPVAALGTGDGFGGGGGGGMSLQAASNLLPFSLETSPDNPLQITGIKARLFNLNF